MGHIRSIFIRVNFCIVVVQKKFRFEILTPGCINKNGEIILRHCFWTLCYSFLNFGNWLISIIPSCEVCLLESPTRSVCARSLSPIFWTKIDSLNIKWSTLASRCRATATTLASAQIRRHSLDPFQDQNTIIQLQQNYYQCNCFTCYQLEKLDQYFKRTNHFENFPGQTVYMHACETHKKYYYPFRKASTGRILKNVSLITSSHVFTSSLADVRTVKQRILTCRGWKVVPIINTTEFV